MGQFGLGQPVRRVEDFRLLTGAGRYTDDIVLPDQAIGYVLRSPHAHARVLSIDYAAAIDLPGVLGIFTADDLAADGLQDIPCSVPLTNRDGSPCALPTHPILVRDRVRHVGDQVVFIVAETLEQARDAAEAIVVDYDILPAVTDTAAAFDADQPRVWDDIAENRCFDWEMGDEKAVDAAFAKATHVSTIDLVNNRIIVASMETRNAIGHYDPATDFYTLYTSSQGAHSLRKMIGGGLLGVPEDRIRVVTPDVGGGFGMKLFLYPEHLLVLHAAKRVGRPVHWSGDRSEACLTDTHGRDHVSHAEVAMDGAGLFLAWRIHTKANLGAYLSNYATFVPTMAGSGMLAGVYRTPSIYVRVEGCFTNTTPVDAYRGAGRPEAAYLVERLVDKAARDLGMDPAELRRRNFIQPQEMPYRTALGLVYDSGDFDRNLTDALRIADRDGLAARKAAALARGRYLGFGFSCYIEQCGGGSDEMADLRLESDGRVTLMIGTQASGQGHETAYAQIVADGLGLPIEAVRVVQGDTAIVSSGRGTGGSRSLPVGGASTHQAVQQAIARGKRIAAHQLEAATDDIVFENGVFTIIGTDRRMTLSQVVERAHSGTLPSEISPPGFEEVARWAPSAGTFPNGTHVCEVEIDPTTGSLDITRYVVVDDFGTVVNPLMLAGQVHGGVGQGIGQALLEAAVYDPDSGQLLSGSFMDYALPRAIHIPPIEFSVNVVPCTTNLLGIKGAGEAGAIGAPPAVVNAVIDALAPYGVTSIDMPVSPERIWRTLESAKTTRQAAE